MEKNLIVFLYNYFINEPNGMHKLLCHSSGEIEEGVQEQVRTLLQVLPAHRLLGRMADAVGRGDEDHGRVRDLGQDLGVVAGAARHRQPGVAELLALRLKDSREARRDRYGARLVHDLRREGQAARPGDVLSHVEQNPLERLERFGRMASKLERKIGLPRHDAECPRHHLDLPHRDHAPVMMRGYELRAS
jgi:hypothetical protein